MPNFINNQWLEASGEKFQSISPIDGTIIGELRASTPADIDLAINAARTALKEWRRLELNQRISYVERFVDLLIEKKEKLAKLLSRETGKVIKECEVEIDIAVSKFKISVAAYHDRCKNLARDFPLAKSLTMHKPHGVIAVYGPYNFPVHVPNGHIMPALIAGNTIVLKPSELTPFISEEIVRIWKESELPAGVINLVQGKSDTGIALSKHDGLDGIFFTGSSKVGKLLHENYSGKLAKVLALELGGNNPLVVWQNSDLNKACDIIILSAFSSNGQRCTCARRLILEDNTKSLELLDLLKHKTQALKISQSLDPEAFMGPVISAEQANKLLVAQESLMAKGAKAILEMKRLELGEAYLSPAILDCTNVNDIVDEEYFGPLLQVYRVPNWDSAIKLANSTEYGLSAGLISDSEDLFQEFSWEIEAGLVNWNNQTTGATSLAPFGGIKMSGNHNPSAYYAADYCAYPVAMMLGD
jgi:succinylglutamic semialdehyde dehydrogenase